MKAPASVEFCFDYASPWAYLADAILDRRLPGVPIAYRPIYLRGLETFSKGLPYTANKLAYVTQDFARVAAYEAVPVAPPPQFPINGIHALRAAYVALDLGSDVFLRYHGAMFRAAWVEQADVGALEVVARLLASVAPLVESAALDALRTAQVKERLREETAKAEARGVFGTPTFFVGDEMFWG